MKQNLDKRDIRPFVYGGLASIIAEFGNFFFIKKIPYIFIKKICTISKIKKKLFTIASRKT